MTTTTRASRHPEPGEVYWADLDPVLGSEQAGRRPVLVLSDGSLHRISSRVLICPITSNPQDWPTKVPIPEGCAVRGFVLTDEARMIDRDSRMLRYIGRLPDDITTRVRYRVAAYMGIEPVIEPSRL
jgi:mRNA interferase MazF